jgi:hypothetical protein
MKTKDLLNPIVIDKVFELCNKDDFIRKVEPHVSYRFHMDRWQVERTLRALDEIIKEKR